MDRGVARPALRLRRLSGDPAIADDEEAGWAKCLAEYRALEEAYAGQDDPEEIDINIG